MIFVDLDAPLSNCSVLGTLSIAQDFITIAAFHPWMEIKHDVELHMPTNSAAKISDQGYVTGQGPLLAHPSIVKSLK